MESEFIACVSRAERSGSNQSGPLNGRCHASSMISRSAALCSLTVNVDNDTVGFNFLLHVAEIHTHTHTHSHAHTRRGG